MKHLLLTGEYASAYHIVCIYRTYSNRSVTISSTYIRFFYNVTQFSPPYAYDAGFMTPLSDDLATGGVGIDVNSGKVF